MRKDAPLALDVPSPDRDGPSWVTVGVIAAVGFLVGVAWPRLLGVRPGPSAPGEAAAAAAASASAARAGVPAPEAPSASITAKTPAAPASAPALPASAAPSSGQQAAGPPSVHVQKSAVLSCKTEDGETRKGKECGSVASLDQLVTPRLRKLAQCSAVEGQAGKLSFVVNADAKSGRLGWDVGKSSTVGNLEGVTSCLKTLFHGTALGGVTLEHAKYTVAYSATLSVADKAADKADPSAAQSTKANDKAKDDKFDAPPQAASGEGTVAWEVALVRDVPKTGQVVTRLHRGDKVKLGSAKDGWYSIKYGDGFASEGWLYRGALGK